MLDEECNPHKKEFTVTFSTGSKQRRFLKNLSLQRADVQTDIEKTAFGSKRLPFHLVALNDGMCLGFFLLTVYLKTLRIVGIFYKDLQESVFEKHLSRNWVVGAQVS